MKKLIWAISFFLLVLACNAQTVDSTKIDIRQNLNYRFKNLMIDQALLIGGKNMNGSDITSFKAKMDSARVNYLLSQLASVASTGSYYDLLNLPVLSTVSATGSYNDLLNLPTSFTPSTHTHPISQIISLQAALDTKLSTSSPEIANWDAAFIWGNHALAGYEYAANKASDFSVISSIKYPTVAAVNTWGNSNFVPIIRTINGYQLNADIVLSKNDIGLNNVPNINTTNANNISTGTLPDARLSGNVTIMGNTFNNGNQLLKLDGGGKVPVANLPSTLMIYKGLWDATDNTPTLTNGTGTSGFVYQISNSGGGYAIHNWFGILDTFYNGDFILYNGTSWEVSGNTDNVKSVNGIQGVVNITTDNVAQGITNKYYANSLVQTFSDSRYSQLGHTHTWSNIVSGVPDFRTKTENDGYYQPKENQRLSTTDNAVFNDLQATTLKTAAPQGAIAKKWKFGNVQPSTTIVTGTDQNGSSYTYYRKLLMVEVDGTSYAIPIADSFYMPSVGTPDSFLTRRLANAYYSTLGHQHSISDITSLSDSLLSKITPVISNLTAGDFLKWNGTAWVNFTPSSFTQVNADWNATTGAAQILNKPDLSGYATQTYVQNYNANNREVIAYLTTTDASATTILSYAPVAGESGSLETHVVGIKSDGSAGCTFYADVDYFYNASSSLYTISSRNPYADQFNASGVNIAYSQSGGNILVRPNGRASETWYWTIYYKVRNTTGNGTQHSL